MRRPSVAELSVITTELKLQLTDEELERLLPMVRDLLDVATRLRSTYGRRFDKIPRTSG